MSEFWKDRSVLVTGHTGFQGSWLTLMLLEKGANVHGLSLSPPSDPSLFEAARLEEVLAGHTIGDVRDDTVVRTVVEESKASVIFHLAAQPLVREAYQDPVGTFSSNVMGTVHVLDTVRGFEFVEGVLVYTSDKCYENKEWSWAYRESDSLGGHDPYSASKGCAEIVAASYRRSFFQDGPHVVTVRAGNVIGGGDWAADRIVPDAMRAFAGGHPLQIRSPTAVRPWQHVLEPLYGCLQLMERRIVGPTLDEHAFNFGPGPSSQATVRDVADHLASAWPGARVEFGSEEGPHEANLLRLDTGLVRDRLQWSPCLDLEDAVRWTVDWYRDYYAQGAGFDARAATWQQIQDYFAKMDGGRS